MLVGKLPVAGIVSGHGHDGAGAVTHQYKVGHPERNFFAAYRVYGGDANWHALLFHRLERRFRCLRLFALLDKRVDVGVANCCLLRERMLCCHSHVRDAKQRVGPRRKYRQWLVFTFDIESQLDSLRTADPVALHRFD